MFIYTLYDRGGSLRATQLKSTDGNVKRAVATLYTSTTKAGFVTAKVALIPPYLVAILNKFWHSLAKTTAKAHPMNPTTGAHEAQGTETLPSL
jgi:hypothetical protein